MSKWYEEFVNSYKTVGKVLLLTNEVMLYQMKGGNNKN